MDKDFKKIICAIGMLTLFFSTNILSADEMAAPMAGGMDEAVMAKMQEYSTVNENHHVLDFFIGKWDYTMKMWMSPEMPPEESNGTGETVSIMDGRFIEQHFNGMAMGAPFTGRGTMGYDNLKKQYVFTWIDNMATGIMTSTGTYDAATKTLTEHGSHSCPLSENGKREVKAVTTMIDENTYSYEMYNADPAGNEFKSMEIIYKRKI